MSINTDGWAKADEGDFGQFKLSLPDCVVNINKSSSNSVVAIIADSVVVDCSSCFDLPQSAGNVGLVVSAFGVDIVVDPKTEHFIKTVILCITYVT